MVRHMLHGLEPIVWVSELGNDKRVVWIAVVTRVLKPMLVACQLGLDLDGMIKAVRQVAANKKRTPITKCESTATQQTSTRQNDKKERKRN